MEIKDNELIIIFMEVDNYVNTFTYVMKEDSDDAIIGIYKAFVKWCCGLDTHTKSIFENSDLWYEIRSQILEKLDDIYQVSPDDTTLSVTKNGVAFNGTIGFTAMGNESPFTHSPTVSGDLTIEMYDQFLDDVVFSERTFRLLVLNPEVIDCGTFFMKEGS